MRDEGREGGREGGATRTYLVEMEGDHPGLRVGGSQVCGFDGLANRFL